VGRNPTSIETSATGGRETDTVTIRRGVPDAQVPCGLQLIGAPLLHSQT
jgi:hypothetical protein